METENLSAANLFRTSNVRPSSNRSNSAVCQDDGADAGGGPAERRRLRAAALPGRVRRLPLRQVSVFDCDVFSLIFRKVWHRGNSSSLALVSL